MDKNKWDIFLRAIDEISEAQIKCELQWDVWILSLTSRGWIDEGKLFFKSPYNDKSYDIRDALIIQREKSSIDNKE
jgi:hypothetical protein